MNKELTPEVRKQLSDRLCRVAEAMEFNCDSEDKSLLKELRREYKSITNQLYPKTKEHELPTSKVKESRKAALEKIKEYLDKEDVEQQFENTKENEKIVVWVGNVDGFPKEFTIEAVDKFYTSYSGGVKCITARRCLFSEKQLKGYHSWERALIEIGLKLCSGRKEKQEFFDKYAVRYNEKLKTQNNG